MHHFFSDVSVWRIQQLWNFSEENLMWRLTINLLQQALTSANRGEQKSPCGVSRPSWCSIGIICTYRFSLSKFSPQSIQLYKGSLAKSGIRSISGQRKVSPRLCTLKGFGT